MEIFLYGLLIVAILAALAFVVYEFRKAGSGLGDAFEGAMTSLFGPSKVVTPKAVQQFIDQPSNQAYAPWKPQVEEDESYPPAWLSKGGTP
jgi:hypothetical protein